MVVVVTLVVGLAQLKGWGCVLTKNKPPYFVDNPPVILEEEREPTPEEKEEIENFIKTWHYCLNKMVFDEKLAHQAVECLSKDLLFLWYTPEGKILRKGDYESFSEPILKYWDGQAKNRVSKLTFLEIKFSKSPDLLVSVIWQEVLTYKFPGERKQKEINIYQGILRKEDRAWKFLKFMLFAGE